MSARVWDEALAADRPVVIDVKADPNVIALPPHASFEQTKNLFLALARGDSDRGAISGPALQAVGGLMLLGRSQGGGRDAHGSIAAAAK